jgi:hypothetical protein
MEAEVDKELADERARAMEEKLAKEAAIRAKQDELQKLRASQRDEVCCCASLMPLRLGVRDVVAFSGHWALC